MRDALAAAYPRASSFRFHAPEHGLITFACAVLELDGFSLRKTTSTGYQAVSRATETVRINLPLVAGVVVSARSGELCAVPGNSGIAFCADETVGRNVLPAYSGFYVELTREQVARHAERLIGRPPKIVRIGHAIDLRQAIGSILFRTIAETFYDACHLEANGLGTLARATHSDFILGLATSAVLPQITEELTRPRNDLGRSIPERAREEIEAHAAEPIRLTTLAERLGVSLRALELAFVKRYGCTPSQILRDSRLRLARNRLLAATPTTTITEVAIGCGFSNPGAFAARYRAAFGELPSETLGRVKRL
ncbi:MAG: AraC family transcriptional regulator [Fimbriimonadaceae bacterium]